jgi:hypothetical protein
MFGTALKVVDFAMFKTALSKIMNISGVTDNALHDFFNYVNVEPSDQKMRYPEFKCAVRYLIAKHKPESAAKWQDPIPGMPNYPKETVLEPKSRKGINAGTVSSFTNPSMGTITPTQGFGM